MSKIHIIHFVESSQRHDWLERFILLLESKGFTQSLITIEAPGAIQDFLCSMNPLVDIRGSRESDLSLVGGIMEIKRARKKSATNLVISLGHLPAFITALASFAFDFIFVVSHMQQPRYFEFMDPLVKSKAHDFIHKMYLRRADLILSLSLEVYERLLKYRIAKSKIAQVYIGMNFDKLQHKLQSNNPVQISIEETPRVLMVGRFAPEKNYDIGIRAFAEFARDFPSASLSIVGKGPLELEIIKLAEELGLSHRFHVLGYVDNVPKLMTNFDLLLHLASTESYGQIYMEALASGLPVLCSRTGVAIDLAENHEPGVILIKELTPKSVSKDLIKFFTVKPTGTPEVAEFFTHFFDHEDKFVYQRIIDEFLRLSISK
jgi:glycosyltransferase involved in cell wall biosynthesis